MWGTRAAGIFTRDKHLVGMEQINDRNDYVMMIKLLEINNNKKLLLPLNFNWSMC